MIKDEFLTAECCRAIFLAFAPPDSDSIKYHGVKQFTVTNEFFEIPDDQGYWEKVPSRFVVLDIVFIADCFQPETRREGFFGGPGKLESGGWFKCSVPFTIRMTRDEMAQKLSFLKG